MHLDLIDSLRCPAGHEDTALVAAIDHLEGRYIARGSLGCPVCEARYPIRDYVAWFVAPEPDHARAESPPRIDDDALLRVAALLDMRTPGTRYLLTGDWGWLAAPLAATYDAQLVLINPPGGVAPGDGISILRVGERLPLAPSSAAGMALSSRASEHRPLLDGLVAAIRPDGRIVGPVTIATPTGTKELARDDRHWVAERTAPAVVVPLGRPRR